MSEDTVNNIVYFGGDFSQISQLHPNATVFDLTTGQPIQGCAQTDGEVKCAISDSNGGWFIGGQFSRVGDSIRHSIAHLDSNGRPTGRFRLQGFNHTVNCLAMKDERLYAGGNFTRYSQEQEGEKNLVLCDTTTGEWINGIPKPNSNVKMALADGKGGWYLSGAFSRVGDSLRLGFAYITPEGYVGNFKPEVKGYIETMALDNNYLYIGGEFTAIGDSIRYNIGCIDTETGLATSWKPDADKTVRAILPHDTVVFAGGDFLATGGATRHHLAAIHKTTGKATNLNIEIIGEKITGLAIWDNTLFISGAIWYVKPVFTYGIAAINLNNNQTIDWSPSPNETINTMTIMDSLLIIGGNFTKIGATTRRHLAAFKLPTRSLSDWNPGANGEVHSMVTCGKKLFVGGAFDSIANTYQEYLAALFNDGTLASWRVNAEIQYDFPKVFTNGSSIIATASEFYESPNNCSSFACIDLQTEQLHDTLPRVNGTINTILLHGETLYAGGSFSQIDSTSRHLLASFKLPTMQLLPLQNTFGASGYGGIRSMTISHDRLFLAGYFSSVGYQDRAGIAAVDMVSGDVLPWNPGGNSFMADATAIREDGEYLYVSGYLPFNGETKNGIGRYHYLTAASDGWWPNTNSGFRQIVPVGNRIYTVGNMQYDTLHPNTAIACFDKTTGEWIETETTVSGSINSISFFNNRVFAGGSFIGTHLYDNKYLGAFDANTLDLLPWQPKANDWVTKVLHHKNSLYIAGNFTEIEGVTCSGISKISIQTGMPDPSWNPLITCSYCSKPSIKNIAHFYNMLMISGNFDTINGIARNGFAVLDAITGNLMNQTVTLSPSTAYITEMRVQDSTLYVVGKFTSINGTNRNNGVAIRLPDFSVIGWNPFPNTGIYGLHTDENAVVIQEFRSNGSKSEGVHVTAVDKSTGTNKLWELPTPSLDVCVTAQSSDSLYFAGKFLDDGGINPYNLVGFKDYSPQPLNWIPMELTNPIDDYFFFECLTANSHRIIAGGFFYWNHNSSTAHLIYIPVPPARPGIIEGVANPCPAMNGNTYSVLPVPNTQYTWSYTGQGANIVSGQGTHAIVVDFDSAATPGYIVVKPRRDGATGNGRSFRVDFSPIIPSKPVGNNLVDLLLTPTSNYFCNNLGADASIIWTLQPDSLGTITNLADTAVITWLKTGTAQLFARVDYTCGTEYSDTLTIVVKNASATPEIANNTPRVTPNPFNRLLTLEIPSGQTATKVELFDITGSLIFSTSGDFTGKKVLDPGPLPKGIYLLRVAGGNVWTTKLVRY